MWKLLNFTRTGKNFVEPAYASLSNTRTVLNKRTGRPIFGPPVFLFDILLNKNPKTLSNKAVQVEIFWQNK